jgi:hypothetical protein
LSPLRASTEAFERLASQPDLSPLLVLTQQQLRLLAAASAAPLPLLPQLPATPDLSLHLHDNGDGGGGGGCSIAVQDYVTWTDEAWAAAAAGATVTTTTTTATSSSTSAPTTGQLAVLALTGPVLQDLLQHHPHEGVREQLYAAGLLPKRKALLAALGEVVALRQGLAAARGWRSYAHMALQVGCLALCLVWWCGG